MTTALAVDERCCRGDNAQATCPPCPPLTWDLAGLVLTTVLPSSLYLPVRRMSCSNPSQPNAGEAAQSTKHSFHPILQEVQWAVQQLLQLLSYAHWPWKVYTINGKGGTYLGKG